MRLLEFARAQKGGVSVLTALSTVALIGFVGFGTDVGSVYMETRRLQGAVDLAALAAAEDPNAGQAVAAQTLQLNRFDARVSTQRGRYTADRATPPANRFVAGASGANAVRVEARASAPLYFARLFVPSGRMEIRRTATAATAQLASFEIGSRLLSLNGGIANSALSALTGSSVSLSVMDYNALATADVDLLAYMGALHTRMNLQAASFDRTLEQRTDTSVAIDAIADVLAPTNRRAETAMRQIARSARGSVNGLDDLIDLGPYGAQDTATLSQSSRVSVSAMDLATAILEIAGGERQVRFQVGAGLPGIASTDVWLAIGERPNNSPWLSVTDDRDVIIRTAQMRLYVVANVNAAAPLATVRVPVLVEAASAQARLAAMECGAGNARSVTLSVAPSIGSISLGEVSTGGLNNFRAELRPTPAQLVNLGLARVEGDARVELGGLQWQDVQFSGADIDNRRIKTVATRDAARAALTTLLGRTHLTVRAGGLGLGAPVLTSATRNALTAAGAPLDTLINGLTDLLGVHLGEADVRVNGIRCNAAVLVA